MSWLPDWLTGYDRENAERAAAADAQLREMNETTYGGTELEEIVARNYETQGGFTVEEQRDEIQEVFDAELQTRADAIIGTPFKALGAVLKATLFAVPVWVWLIAAGIVFVWLGGPAWVRGKLAKA